MFSLTAKVAVTAAACPIAMLLAWTRAAEFASRSLETQRPATMMFFEPFGMSAPRGKVWQDGGYVWLQVVTCGYRR